MNASKTEAPDIIVWIITRELSDGSEVFDVDLNGQIFEAVSEDDAEQLAEAFADAISSHTNSTAGVLRG
jgi:hypothetical protein